MLLCIKRKADDKEISSEAITNLYISCQKKKEQCPLWRNEIQSLYIRYKSEKKEDSIGHCIYLCKKEYEDFEKFFNFQ